MPLGGDSSNCVGASSRTFQSTSQLSQFGSAVKSGFETSYISARFMKYTYVEAIPIDGRILGKSDLQKTILPNGMDDTLTDLTIPAVRDAATAEHREKPILPRAR